MQNIGICDGKNAQETKLRLSKVSFTYCVLETSLQISPKLDCAENQTSFL